MSKHKYQGLGKIILAICLELMLSTASLTAMDDSDLETGRSMQAKRNAFDTDEEWEEKIKKAAQRNMSPSQPSSLYPEQKKEDIIIEHLVQALQHR